MNVFGGRVGLIGALCDRAVAGLFQDLSTVQTSADPLADPYAPADPYRHRGYRRSPLYTVLFGGAQCFDPSGEVDAGDPIRPLLAAIDRVFTMSVLASEATSIALSIWATLHGLVTLVLAGALDAATTETALRSAIHATLRGWATPAVFRGLHDAELAP
ncbi:TetR-like C-terminal domain-containing protein [Streptomyces virginiae]|uniref:TetR-like C-terminal domain-containing protein n=1 Tax=Streptomyces virginiae TaxID=1961 RepID=UPI00368453E6